MMADLFQTDRIGGREIESHKDAKSADKSVAWASWFSDIDWTLTTVGLGGSKAEAIANLFARQNGT